MHKSIITKDRYKAKTLEGVVCTDTCLCFGTMLDFLRFTIVDPRAPTWFFLNDIVAIT
jgi:hypothetical protein